MGFGSGLSRTREGDVVAFVVEESTGDGVVGTFGRRETHCYAGERLDLTCLVHVKLR